MAARRWTIACAAVLLAGTQLFPERLHALPEASQATVQAPADDNSVPADLRPLLAAPESELRLVTQRYNTDRATLNGNYDGGRGPGRGGAAARGAAAAERLRRLPDQPRHRPRHRCRSRLTGSRG